MSLKEIALKLEAKGLEIEHRVEDVIEKVIIKSHDRYHDVLKYRNGNYHFDSYLKEKEGKTYSKEEYQELKARKAEHVELFNSLDLGTIFDRFAIAPALG